MALWSYHGFRLFGLVLDVFDLREQLQYHLLRFLQRLPSLFADVRLSADDDSDVVVQPPEG